MATVISNQLIITQNVSSPEIRAVHHAIAISDGYSYVNVDISELGNYIEQLNSGAIPVGSVEFITEALNILGKPVPVVNPYPSELKSFFGREIRSTTKGGVSGGFVKPVAIKLFTGFVLGAGDPSDVRIYDGLPSDTLVYNADVVDFVVESRFYINGRTMLGHGRYDDSDDEREVDVAIVQSAIDLLNLDRPYALDFGITSTGETLLVEFTDFWAIGYYKGTMTSKDYLNLLVDRWNTI